nr:MAG TPA: hypothetical protein [Caudoviricetes sp.]
MLVIKVTGALFGFYIVLCYARGRKRESKCFDSEQIIYYPKMCIWG